MSMIKTNHISVCTSSPTMLWPLSKFNQNKNTIEKISLVTLHSCFANAPNNCLHAMQQKIYHDAHQGGT